MASHKLREDKSKNWRQTGLHPTLLTSLIFVLLFSGPPMFRIRDPNASLEGVIDPSAMFQICVWIAGGVWIANQLRLRLQRNVRPLRILFPYKIGFLLVGLLALSTLVSEAPSLTAFKAYQMLVSMIFTLIYAEDYGIGNCLDHIFWASTILCAAIAICVLVAPDLVLFTTETGALRLRGELIAPTGIVSLLALILLMTRVRYLWTPLRVGLFLFFGTLLICSLERTAYVAFLGFAALVVLRRNPSKGLKGFACVLLFAACVFGLAGGGQYFDQFRDSGSIWTLSDRVGLWAYLAAVTLTKAPWRGLGYFAASRIYGPEYNPGLGTAHSMFFEAFIGAGIPALACLVALCAVVLVYAFGIYRRHTSMLSLAIVGLLLSVLLEGSVGAEICSGPGGITFWSMVTIVSIVRWKENAMRSIDSVVPAGLKALTSQ